MWHRFVNDSSHDQRCSQPECGVVAEDSAVAYVTVECPAPSCSDPTNQGPCRVIEVEDGVECAYCGLQGAPTAALPVGFDDDGELDPI